MAQLVHLSYGVATALLIGLVPLYLLSSPAHWVIGTMVLVVLAADTVWIINVKDRIQVCFII